MDMHGTNSTGYMLARDMAMVFFNAHDTPLFSISWAPSSSGAYAGTCIFLVMLAIVHRALVATKTIIEARWRDQAWKRRYIMVAGKGPLSEKLSADADSTTGVLSANGVEENVKMIRHQGHGIAPWRFSVDLPRALFSTVISGVAFLLMLAVMTLNLGYFLSILGGVFVGELMVGRYSHNLEDHH